MTSFGDVRVVSIAVPTPDVGDVVGLGVLFSSTSDADEFLTQLHGYFETPGNVFRSFVVSISENASYCSLAIDVVNQNTTMVVEVDHVDRRVASDIKLALTERPYFFIIACIELDGEVEPYKADENFVARGSIMINNEVVNGNINGKWPKGSNPFA